MKVVHTIAEVRQWRALFAGSAKIGFVPTMGCLHEGHASLIKQSKQDNDFTVVSIFVNPSQFAPTEDLDQYPRTMDADMTLLKSLGVDLLFAPTAKVMYPQGIPLDVEKQRGPFVSVLGVSEMLEGKTRPNFFRGVATVVLKFLNIITPTVAYFGQKDIQQFVVLNTMCNELFVNTTLIMMPIVRGTEGLALSSRNKYLCDESLQIANNLYRGLHAAETMLTQQRAVCTRESLLDTVQKIWQPFIDQGDFKVDYVSFADWTTLEEVNKFDGKVIISCAVYVKDRKDTTRVVRLIDNVVV